MQSTAPLRTRLRIAEAAIRAGAIDVVLHGIASVRYRFPDAHPSRHGVEVTRDLPYGRHRANRLDVYLPVRPSRATQREADGRAVRPLPVVMYVHGGAFTMFSKDTHRIMALALSRMGYLVFNVDYRLGPKHTHPAPLEDATRALLWVRDHAARWGGDPDRIAIAGESAGGNLVCALALASAIRFEAPYARELFDANVRLRAVVSTYGFHDIVDGDRIRNDPRVPRWARDMVYDAQLAYVGHDARAVVQSHPLSSPLAILDSRVELAHPLPPFFCDAGTRDPLLPHTRRLKAALDARGVPCELFVAPGEVHGYDVLVWRPAAREKWSRVGTFLDRNLRDGHEGQREEQPDRDLTNTRENSHKTHSTREAG